MRCPICGSENAEIQITSEVFEYKGHQKLINKCGKVVCDDCKEAIFTDETSKRNEEVLRKLKWG